MYCVFSETLHSPLIGQIEVGCCLSLKRISWVLPHIYTHIYIYIYIYIYDLYIYMYIYIYIERGEVSPLYSQSNFFRSFVSSFGGLPCRCGQDLGTFLKEPCTSEHFCKRDFFLVYSLLCYEKDLLFVYSLIYTCTYISLFCNRSFFLSTL